MNVETMEAWFKSGEASCNLDFFPFSLYELDDSMDARVVIRIADADCVMSVLHLILFLF